MTHLTKEERDGAGKQAADRGTSGQCLFDDKNPPGDPHTGKRGPGGDVNMDPKSRDDEGY